MYSNKYINIYTTILLLLCVSVVYLYEIEPSLFLFKILAISVGGHFVNQIVNPKYRNITFLLLTPISIAYIFNTTILLYSMVVISILYYLFTLSVHQKIKFLIYAFIIAGLMFTISLSKYTDEVSITLSIIGTLLTYRILIFLYEDRTNLQTTHDINKANYFLMLPTISMYLFPPIDYKTFTASYNSVQNQLIYKKGAIWISQGIFHLVIYRIIYHHIHIPLANVITLTDFAIHAISSYMFVLRLSGIFHIGVGILCLFGYNMPRSFDNYFLATDFSDLWRRLNTYFKDMMVKVFYYPIFFKFKKLGTTNAIILSILIVYNISWFIHSLQWMWLKGTFPVKAGDLIYWNAFGFLVALTTLKDLKNIKFVKFLTNDIKNIIKILLTILIMSILWSFWTAATPLEYINSIKSVTIDMKDYLSIMGIIGIICISIISSLYINKHKKLSKYFFPDTDAIQSNHLFLTILILLSILQYPNLNSLIQSKINLNLSTITKDKLNDADEDKQIEGYYTDLLLGTNIVTNLQSNENNQNQKFIDSEGAIKIQDYRGLIMKPKEKITFKDKEFSINSLGGRDREYSTNTNENTIRMLVTGGSFVTGSGVADNEVFDNIIEDSINKISQDVKIELLNFGIPTYDLIDVLIQLKEDNLLKLNPNYLIYISQGKDLFKNTNDLAFNYLNNIPINDTFLLNIINQANVNKSMTELEIRKSLKKYSEEVLQYGYNEIFKICKKNNITPILVYWPTHSLNTNIINQKNHVIDIASKAGFKVYDLQDIYKGFKKNEITVSASDIHPNAKAHKIFADNLMPELMNLLKNRKSNQ